MTVQREENAIAVPRYAITVMFEIKIAFYTQFLALVNDNAKTSIHLEPECFQFDVLTPAVSDKSTTVFLYEIYKDRAAFDDHLASDHFHYFEAATKDMVLQKTVVDFLVHKNIKA